MPLGGGRRMELQAHLFQVLAGVHVCQIEKLAGEADRLGWVKRSGALLATRWIPSHRRRQPLCVALLATKSAPAVRRVSLRASQLCCSLSASHHACPSPRLLCRQAAPWILCAATPSWPAGCSPS